MRLLRFGMAASFVALGASAVTSLTACPIATVGVFDAYMSIDGERRQNVFFTDSKNIVCTADVRGGRTNATTEFLVRQTQILNLQRTATPVNAVLVYADFQGAGKQTLELKPKKKDAGADDQQQEVKPFPAGRFQCEVYIDGKLEETLPFNVDYAPCPAQLIEDGAICEGFYEQNRSCPQGGIGVPGNGIPETSLGRCTCSGQAGAKWQCATK